MGRVNRSPKQGVPAAPQNGDLLQQRNPQFKTCYPSESIYVNPCKDRTELRTTVRYLLSTKLILFSLTRKNY